MAGNPAYRMLSESEAQIAKGSSLAIADPSAKSFRRVNCRQRACSAKRYPPGYSSSNPIAKQTGLNPPGGKPPIIARIQEQSVVLDPRTVQTEEEIMIIQRLKQFLE